MRFCLQGTKTWWKPPGSSSDGTTARFAWSKYNKCHTATTPDCSRSVDWAVCERRPSIGVPRAELQGRGSALWASDHPVFLAKQQGLGITTRAKRGREEGSRLPNVCAADGALTCARSVRCCSLSTSQIASAGLLRPDDDDPKQQAGGRHRHRVIPSFGRDEREWVVRNRCACAPTPFDQTSATGRRGRGLGERSVLLRPVVLRSGTLRGGHTDPAHRQPALGGYAGLVQGKVRFGKKKWMRVGPVGAYQSVLSFSSNGALVVEASGIRNNSGNACSIVAPAGRCLCAVVQVPTEQNDEKYRVLVFWLHTIHGYTPWPCWPCWPCQVLKRVHFGLSARRQQWRRAPRTYEGDDLSFPPLKPSQGHRALSENGGRGAGKKGQVTYISKAVSLHKLGKSFKVSLMEVEAVSCVCMCTLALSPFLLSSQIRLIWDDNKKGLSAKVHTQTQETASTSISETLKLFPNLWSSSVKI